MNNRLIYGPHGVYGFKGDFRTPEQHIPATGLDYDWEACQTMNTTWGYKSYDDQWKSSEKLIRNLVDIASKGGNYLLNVGPMANGNIPPESLARLKDVGAWMRVNSSSIYGTTASPFVQNRPTVSPDAAKRGTFYELLAAARKARDTLDNSPFP